MHINNNSFKMKQIMKKTFITASLFLCGIACALQSSATVQVELTCLDEDGNPKTLYTVGECDMINGEAYVEYINDLNSIFCGEYGNGFVTDENGNIIVNP